MINQKRSHESNLMHGESQFDTSQVKYDKASGLVPAVIQDFRTMEVLMLGYMNESSLQLTLASKRVVFFSRTRQQLWQKGATSGNYLELVKLGWDCDQDALLVQAFPAGPTCHTGAKSCFADALHSPNYWLSRLYAIIAQRQRQPQSGSYTSNLLRQPIKRIAQKVGEEGLEIALAALEDDNHHEEFLGEAVDLLYHLYVLFAAKGLRLEDFTAAIAKRHQAKTKSVESTAP